MLKLELDRTGFPMVWVDPLEGFLHWLPVSKVQFEVFLCSATDGRLDDAWYDRILALNPRTTASALRPNNYWRAFLTGLLPDEAQRFARWCGDDFELLTLSDWSTAFDHLKGLDPVEVAWSEELPHAKPRVLQLLQQIDKATAQVIEKNGVERTLADQMLMRLGVMEWVELEGRRQGWGGMGQLNPDWHGLLFRPDRGVPLMPRAAEVERVAYFGLRLLRKAR